MVANAAGVAVLSDAAWRQQFAADPNILGRSITLGNKQYTVVGIANPAFRLDARTDVWTPLPITESAEDHSNEYNFVGAFAVASLLTLLAVLTLVVKTLVERTGYRRR